MINCIKKIGLNFTGLQNQRLKLTLSHKIKEMRSSLHLHMYVIPIPWLVYETLSNEEEKIQNKTKSFHYTHLTIQNSLLLFLISKETPILAADRSNTFFIDTVPDLRSIF